MRIISLQTFVATGRFGKIGLGSTRAELVAFLGQDFEYLDCGEVGILRYGCYEFSYWKKNEQIFTIENDQLQAQYSNHEEMINLTLEKVHFDTWFLKPHQNISFGQVENLLQTAQIAYEKVPLNKYSPTEEQKIRCTQSGVCFEFVQSFTWVKRVGKKFKEYSFEATQQSDFVLHAISLAAGWKHILAYFSIFLDNIPAQVGIKQAYIMDIFMLAAIEEAQKGLATGGIPIGSVLVKNGQIVGRGHNQRVQQGNPIAHGEIDCLENAGRIGSYKNTVLYSTLMPCFLCAGAVVQFGIRKVIVGENQTFQGAEEFMRSQGVEVTNLNDPTCIQLMTDFIQNNPTLWNEDIGVD